MFMRIYKKWTEFILEEWINLSPINIVVSWYGTPILLQGVIDLQNWGALQPENMFYIEPDVL